MKVARRSLLQCAGGLGLATLWPMPSRAAAPFKGAAEIQAMIDSRVAAGQLQGAIVSLGTGSASPDYVMGGTLALDSPVKVDENSIWRIVSMTKPVVGMAAMLLIAEGKLKIDQPVADYIPGFGDMRVLPDPQISESRPAARLITIRHLVTHTSGLVNGPTGKALAEGYRLARGGTPPTSLEEWANRMSKVPLVSHPGAKWNYSPGLEVIARVIEVISGMPFDAFLERRIFAPLGMRSTYFHVPERDRARLATNYFLGPRGLRRDPGSDAPLTRPVIPNASMGLLSSARDYDRFMAMVVNGGILDGTRVMPAAAVGMGTSNLLPPGTDMSAYTATTGYDGFGAGGMVTTGGPRPGTFGWGGAAGTSAFFNPAMKSRWGSYTNIGASDFGRLAMGAANMLIDKQR